jgi:hypothetical protein
LRGSIGYRSALFILFLLSAASLQAQESDPELPLPGDVVEKSLYVIVGTSIISADSSEFQNSFYRLTLPGKPVTIKVRARDGRIIIHFTPYMTGDDFFVLFAQNEIWAKPADGESLQYFTSFSSIPLHFGDKAVFYPMGKKEKGEYIQMIVVIVPYSWVADKGIQPESLLVDQKK